MRQKKCYRIEKGSCIFGEQDMITVLDGVIYTSLPKAKKALKADYEKECANPIYGQVYRRDSFIRERSGTAYLSAYKCHVNWTIEVHKLV